MRHRGLLGRALGLALSLPGALILAQAPAPTGTEPGVAVRGTVIPTGFQGNTYSAMIQIAVDGSPLPNATWDLDASLQVAERDPKEFSGRVAAGDPGTPVVFEAEVEFGPGSYVLHLAARETTAGQSGSRKLEGSWPDPNTERAVVSPLVLLQPVQGTFVRGGSARRQGALALGPEDPVKAPLPTALVGVVCRGKGMTDVVRVRRKLEGASSVDFDTFTIRPDGDQCLQVRDIIPAGTLGEGHFRYEVQLMTDSGQVAVGSREFKTGS